MFGNLFIFYLVVIVLVISTVLVVFSEHVVFALFFLVLSFIFSAILLLLFECEFLALMFIIIYVGAIAVLFLFIIMMVDIKFKNLSNNLIIYLISGLIFILFVNFLLFEKINTIIGFKNTLNINFYINWYDLIISTNETKSYSFVLYNFFSLQFLLVGFILLVVLIGIVYFTKSFFNKKVRDQSIFKQISTNSKFLS